MACVFSRRVLAGAAGVIVPTGKVRSLLRRYRVKAPIYEVPTGLELERLMERSTTSVCRADFGLSDDDFVMLYLGRLGAEKNIGEIIGLLDRVSERAGLCKACCRGRAVPRSTGRKSKAARHI